MSEISRNIAYMANSNTPTSDPESPTNAPVSADDRLRAIEERYRRHIITLVEKSPTSSGHFDLSRLYPETNEIDVLREQVHDLKRCLDSLRPISAAQLRNLEEAFDTEYTYESNRIEGNTLTLNETAMVIQYGITIGGKPLKDHFEAVNHRDAIRYIRSLVERNAPFTFDELMAIHALILSGIDRENAGRFRNMNVRISGSAHVFPNWAKLPELTDEFFEFYESEKTGENVVDFAAKIHARLVNIHPFVDGNGRTARLVMNLILLRHGYVVANISGDKKKRAEYYAALEASHADGSMNDFVRFVLRTEKDSLFEYIGMLDPDIQSGRGDYYLERIAPFLDEQ